MAKLKNIHTLKAFFLTKKINGLKIGEHFMEEQLVVDDKANLEQQLQEAKNSLNIKKIIELNEQISVLNSKTEKQSSQLIIEEETPPLTLQEARKNLEYALLKEYLSTKEKQEIELFLETRIDLEDNLKQRLQKAFSTK
ncbi:MAG: hypothetical protein CVV59_00880 [Tenericutes bacterium HGW-Tenericutes-4]|nr:MAG: hypothetical protein CVV59_00880 [Tenericutes bacterium HGW-Tenericutes-4]